MKNGVFLLSLLFAYLSGCGGSSQDAEKQQSGDHPWKAQTDVLQQAKDAAAAADENAEQKRETLQRDAGR